jgi:hypothetical protein
LAAFLFISFQEITNAKPWSFPGVLIWNEAGTRFTTPQ